MSRAALVIHTISYPFIEKVALYIHNELREHFGFTTPLLICDSVDDAQHVEDTTVFLIGENFPVFRRKPRCRYVYLNFSVVTVLGQPWGTGLKARRAIQYKWKLLTTHLPSVDVLLDYYPPQTEVLKRKLKQPVLGFAVASPPQHNYTPMHAREYDVCFVCSPNERRLAVRHAIERLGLTLSPSTGIAIEDAAAQSRLCLNVHAVKSHHFETPRFVAALSCGTPVVSEPSFASDTIVDQRFITAGDYSRLPALLAKLLCHPDQLEDMGRKAHHWYAAKYFPEARDQWRKTIGSVRDCLDHRAGSKRIERASAGRRKRLAAAYGGAHDPKRRSR